MKNTRTYVGLDMHKSFSYATVLTQGGEIITRDKNSNKTLPAWQWNNNRGKYIYKGG